MQDTKVIFKREVKRTVGAFTAVVSMSEKIIPMREIFIHADGRISEWHGEGGGTVSLSPADVEIRIL